MQGKITGFSSIDEQNRLLLGPSQPVGSPSEVVIPFKKSVEPSGRHQSATLKDHQAVGDKKTINETGSEEQSAVRTRQPSLFRVLMHNDDYTTMEFVVQVLETVFHKPAAEANRIMLNVHAQGVGVCGTYPHEVAETKVYRVHKMARSAGYPLRCSLEEA